VFARAERSDVASGAALPAVENGSPDEPEVGAARRSVRSPQLIALVLALACTAACQSTTVAGPGARVRVDGRLTLILEPGEALSA